MGRLDGKFIRGVVGDAIFKEHRGQQIIQGKSDKEFIAMTVASFDAAFVFGRASTLASYFRNGVHALVGYYDGAMPSRLTGECNQILQKAAADGGKSFQFEPEAFSRLNGFEFNNASLVRNQLFIQPMITLDENMLHIDLPEMKIPGDLKFPRINCHCAIGFNVTLYNLEDNSYLMQDVQSVEIKQELSAYHLPARRLSFQSAPGCLCIIGLSLYYFEKTFAGNSSINSKSFSPAAILKACLSPGNAQPSQGWQKMSFKDKKKRKGLISSKKKL